MADTPPDSTSTPPTPVPATAKYSLRGYRFKAFLKGNKEAAKLVLTAAAGYGAYAASLVSDPALNALTVALCAAVVKLVLDGFDYWLTG